MGIEEEIYSKLVEQFGIGEVCIKAHTQTKRQRLNWVDFIRVALKTDAVQLYDFCGFKPDGSSFSRYFRREYKELMLKKSKTTWKQFLPSILDYKICSKCKSLKERSEFTYRNHTVDNLTYICKTCEQEYRAIHREYYHTKDKERRNLLHSSILLQKKVYYTENKVSIDFGMQSVEQLNLMQPQSGQT